MKHHKHDIIESLGKKVVLLDGGMGSMLIAAGLKDGHPPEEWNISNSDSLTRIHSAYLEAGAEVIQANTFGATRVKLDATTVWLNERAERNHIPYPAQRPEGPHYTRKDALALLIAGLTYAKQYW